MSKTSFFKQSGTNNVGSSGNDATDPTEIADTASDSSFFKQSGVNSEVNSNLTQRATDAETAKTAAEAAQASAETAATNAAASETAAQSSANSASTSSSTASTSATTATTKASEASTSATNASTSASAAATSASNASTSETNAATSATSASTSTTAAQTAQTAAETAKTAAETAQTAAETAKTAAETAETNANSASTSASNSSSTATTQASTATTKAGEAATSATNAATSETNAATSETNAATSETNASTSATNAATSETNAATSASTASTQAGIATTKAGEASTSATSAQTAQTASEDARDLALAYRNTAETHKDAAASSATTASTQAATATTQAGISTTKAGEASSSASSAASAQTAAEAARDSALTAFDNFDDRYLGSKTSDPTVDNDGNALVGGALYFDSTNGIMKVYTGSAWVAAYASTAGTLLVANNLSDVQSAATSRTNLGLSTVAATGAYSDLTGKPSLFDGAFSSLSGKPTTISGYGITDALQLGTTSTTALAGNTSIPSTLTDLGISDGTSNQVLSTDGSGSFTFVNQSGGGGATQDADGDTKIQVEETTDDDTIRFDTAGVQRAVIDDSGNLLLGHTGSIFNNINATSTVGSSYSANGEIFACSDQSSGVMFLNRKTTDGAFATFRKDGTTVGSINSRAGEFIAIGYSDTYLEFNAGSNQINPSSGTAARDNAIDLGSSGSRFKDLYLSGDINTNSNIFADNAVLWNVSSSDSAHQRADARDDSTNFSRLHWYGVRDSGSTSNFRHAWYDGSDYVNVTASGNAVNFQRNSGTTYLQVQGNTVWHAGNDGSGSGLDADTLDGINSTGFVLQLSTSTTPNYQTPSSRRVDPNGNNPTNEHYAITTFGNGGNVTGQIAAHFQTGQLYSRGYNSSFSSWRKIWDATNDGSGSGLNADLLDGYHGSFTRNNANTYPIRNSSGYLDLGWINTTSGATTSTVSRIYASQDAYIRYVTQATFRSQVISGQTINEIYNTGWYRTNGSGGWYNQTYGGGINMQDSTYVRTYGSKQFYVNNHIKSASNVYAYWSDDRLKTKIGNIENALDKVQSLSGFTYTRNDVAKSHGFGGDEEEVGVSAQQVKAVQPQAVHLAPFDEKVEDDGSIVSKSGEDYMTVDYPRLVPLLIEAIKELKGQVDDLQTQIKELQ